MFSVTCWGPGIEQRRDYVKMFQERRLAWQWWLQAFNPTYSEFEPSLVYRVSSRQDSQGYRETVLKKRKKPKVQSMTNDA